MIINTKYGQVQGVQEGNVYIYRGIPYALPPTGEHRFKPPIPLNSWDGVLQADQFGPQAYQPIYLPSPPKVLSEDCLSLNIWTPGVERDDRPVLVDIHGGGFNSGSGADYKGFTFAERDNIVCVSLNYRVGALGFLYLGDVLGEAYHTSGNNGILDIVAALTWVKDNIAFFGGDPNRITISGGSAGAKCVTSLLAVPTAKGLYHQLIAQSGATQAIRDTGTANKLTLRLLDKLGIPHHEAHRLLTLPAQTIVDAQDNSLHTFGPVKDGLTIVNKSIDEILTDLERKIPMLVGTNKEEAKLFTTYSPDMIEPSDETLNTLFGKNSVYVMSAYQEALLLYPAEEAWHRTLTDYIYRFATIRFAEWAAGHDQPVWVYQFDFSNRLGAHHGAESAFTIHSLESNPQAEDNPTADLFTVPANGTELAVSMHAAWAAFIHSGVPLAEDLPEWPKFTLSDRSIMILNQECSTTRLPALPDTPFPNQVIVLSDEPSA